MFEVEFTAEALLLVWAFVQSLGFEYIPGLSDWYFKLTKQWKRFTQAIVLLVITLGVFGLGCADILNNVACDQASVIGLFLTWLVALSLNQTTHLAFKKDSKPA